MLRIRSEKMADFDAIHTFVQEAFTTAPVSDGKEQDLVRQLRRSKGYLPALALLVEQQGEIVGYLLLTRFFFAPNEGEPLQALLMGPLCVREEYRGRKIGSMLTRVALNKARSFGFERVFLVGDPAYYGRFGFRPATDFAIENSNGIPARCFLALELAKGALAVGGGRLSVML